MKTFLISLLLLSGCAAKLEPSPAPTPEIPPGKPWVWYAPSFGSGQTIGDPNDQWLISKWADAGIVTKGLDVGESYGSPTGQAEFTAFYDQQVADGFSTKPCFYVRSRGGLQGYNWLANHPDAAACIAGIYPVGDLDNYPGLEKAAPAYLMTPDELKAQLTKYDPIDNLAPLVEKHIPIMHLHGDNDMIVPIERSSQIVHDRYTAMGGEMTLTIIHGQGHDLSPLYFQNQDLADFVIKKVKR